MTNSHTQADIGDFNESNSPQSRSQSQPLSSSPDDREPNKGSADQIDIQNIIDNLPNHIPWKHTLSEYNGAKTIPAKPGELIKVNGDNAGIQAEHIAYLARGYATYKSKTDSSPIEIPRSYSNFESFTPKITKWTANSSTGRVGITHDRLENSLRCITGGGRYNTDNITVYAGDQSTFLIRYNNDTFLIECATIGDGPDTPHTSEADELNSPSRHTINGYTVLEDNDQFRTGINKFSTVFNNHTNFELASYKQLSNSEHLFNTESGPTVAITGKALRKVSRGTITTDEFIGDVEIPTKTQTHELTIPDLPWEIGEETIYNSTVIALDINLQKSRDIYSPTSNTSSENKPILTSGDKLKLIVYSCSGLSELAKAEPTEKVKLKIRRTSNLLAKYENHSLQLHPNFEIKLDNK